MEIKLQMVLMIRLNESIPITLFWMILSDVKIMFYVNQRMQEVPHGMHGVTIDVAFVISKLSQFGTSLLK